MTQQEVSDIADKADKPLEKTETKPKPKGRVIVFGKWCKECGLCIAFCPRNVLGADKSGQTVVVNPDECTACRWCELHCPDFAITVKRIE